MKSKAAAMPPPALPAASAAIPERVPYIPRPVSPNDPRLTSAAPRKNAGFKPIGQQSSAVKRFFPDDDDDEEEDRIKPPPPPPPKAPPNPILVGSRFIAPKILEGHLATDQDQGPQRRRDRSPPHAGRMYDRDYRDGFMTSPRPLSPHWQPQASGALRAPKPVLLENTHLSSRPGTHALYENPPPLK